MGQCFSSSVNLVTFGDGKVMTDCCDDVVMMMNMRRSWPLQRHTSLRVFLLLLISLG